MDSKVKFYAIFAIAVTVGGTLTAIVYSRSEAVIYFWNCTAPVRICNLTNAIIFFALSTIAIMGLLYLPEFIRRFKRNQVKESSSNPGIKTTTEKRVRKPYKVFSRHLDAMTKGKKISSPAMVFLKRVRIAPPFLGELHSDPVLSPEHEKELTEYFQAWEFVTKHKALILFKGEDEYISESLGVSTDYIELQYLISQGKRVKKTLDFLLNSLHLQYSEALELVKIVYDAAQKTLDKENRKEKRAIE